MAFSIMNILVPDGLRIYVFVGSMQLTSSPGRGFSICKTAQRTWLRILSIALKGELKVLDFF